MCLSPQKGRFFSPRFCKTLNQFNTSEILTVQAEPLKQVLKTPNIRKLETTETPLSNLDMVILDAILEEAKSIQAIINEICVYFSTSPDNANFHSLVVLQIRELFNLGAVKMVNK